jgi:hypothetical protein
MILLPLPSIADCFFGIAELKAQDRDPKKTQGSRNEIEEEPPALTFLKIFALERPKNTTGACL